MNKTSVFYPLSYTQFKGRTYNRLKGADMITLRAIKIVAYAGLLSFNSSALLAGDIGVEGNVTATTFVGGGAGLTGVVKTEVDPVVNTLSANKWCKADANGAMINCDHDASMAPEGVSSGDMQYWDGAAWVLIPAPAGDAKMLSMCSGNPIWTDGGCIYAIGDRGPAGGIVFHITDGGLHGLEAAAPEEKSPTWGCWETLIAGADGTAVGTGAQNTADIVAGCIPVVGTPAARIADDYTQNGFTDWFLPSKDELHLLYQQKDVVGGFFTGHYWSSSEIDSTSAWAQRFDNGDQTATEKQAPIEMRAVRAF